MHAGVGERPRPTRAAAEAQPARAAAAQQAQEMAPEGVTVVSALHTVSAPVLGDLGQELDEPGLLAVG